MWQKSEYFCLNSLNRLLKIVEVDDLSNSDKVKSTETGLESQIGTSGILLIAISPTSIFASFNNFLQCIPKESVADSLSLYSSWYLGFNTTSQAGFSGLALSLRTYWKANLSQRFSNGGSWASTYKLSTGEERKAPRLRRRPWLWTGSSLANAVLEAGP